MKNNKFSLITLLGLVIGLTSAFTTLPSPKTLVWHPSTDGVNIDLTRTVAQPNPNDPSTCNGTTNLICAAQYNGGSPTGVRVMFGQYLK